MAMFVDPRGTTPGAKSSRIVVLTVTVLMLVQALWFTVVSRPDSLLGSLQPVQGSEYSRRWATSTTSTGGPTTPTRESHSQNNTPWVSGQGERGLVNRATGGEKGPEIVFGVMGQEKKFPNWLNVMQNLKNSFDVMLVFASFDQPITAGNATLCTAETNCKALFIPNTTFTEGRNKVAEAILCEERARGKKFKWWAFADDDVEDLKCVVSAQSCWYQLLDFLSNYVPHNAVVVAPNFDFRGGDMRPWNGLTTFDAAMNIFKRDYVPILLPYAKLPKGYSEWNSQTALFCIMLTCFRGGGVEPPWRISNSLHRKYIRGQNKTLITNVMRENFLPYLPYDEATCERTIAQRLDFVGPFDSVEELTAFIPPVSASHCSKMLLRFQAWEKNITMC